MSRLLFAAARGARFQVTARDWGTDKIIGWDSDHFVDLEMLRVEHTNVRTHPDDEHLAYGPVSTALRHFANHGWFPNTVSGLMAEETLKYEACYVFHPGVSDEHLATFALLMAEALADEGL